MLINVKRFVIGRDWGGYAQNSSHWPVAYAHLVFILPSNTRFKGRDARHFNSLYTICKVDFSIQIHGIKKGMVACYFLPKSFENVDYAPMVLPLPHKIRFLICSGTVA